MIKCINNKLSKPENYKCFEIKGKYLFLMLNFYYRLLENH